ncbi:MAG TPA: CopD family protein [Thiobacillaceae bacterium]|nr:CopD family protein [Thiobacillaceae bacterium]
MLWIKTFHIVFVVSWFAGLFYLPRIFVNLAMAESQVEKDRLNLMARKLYKFVTPIMGLALVSGIWLWFAYWRPTPDWLWLKVALVVLLVGYHHVCGRLLKDFAAGRNTRSHVWFRWFNEIPVIVLLVVTILVVVKPF